MCDVNFFFILFDANPEVLHYLSIFSVLQTDATTETKRSMEPAAIMESNHGVSLLYYRLGPGVIVGSRLTGRW